ncbi:MAG: hypothetical protein ACYC5K_07355 [Saccharofermentanales bacterium]
MALKKQLVLEKGIVASYFRIANITQNFINTEPLLDVYIYGYTDKTYRDNEKAVSDNNCQEIVFSKFYQLPIDDKKGYSREDIYKRIIKELPEFKGATKI